MLPLGFFCVFLNDIVHFCKIKKKILQNAQRTEKTENGRQNMKK